jgi:hypothetical protein
MRLRTFTRLTEILLEIHDHHLHHGCLYGKHAMVHAEDPENLAMTDLEKNEIQSSNTLHCLQGYFAAHPANCRNARQ